MAALDSAAPAAFDRKLLVRERYGWETYAEPRACRDASEVREFYERMGSTLRLLEFLEGRDLWFDNVIAAGPHPVFIDLETLLYGKRLPATRDDLAGRRIQSVLEESAAYTGVLVAATPISAGHRAEDMGALAPPRTVRLPYRPMLRGLQAQLCLTEIDPAGFVTMAPPPYAAMLDGKPETADRHLSTLLAGYRQVDSWLADHGRELVNHLETQYGIANVIVRHIHRDTWSYAREIQQSVSPTALRGGIHRDIALWKTVRLTTTDDPKTDARIRAAEVAAIRELNIPFFRTRPGSRGLILEDGDEVPNVIAAPALARLRERACKDPMNVGQRVDVLLSSLGSGACGRRRRPVLVRGAGTEVGEDRAVALASSVGDLVLSSAVREGSDIAWAGLVYDPRHDLEILRVVDDDLMTGTCGIALFLTDLYRVTGTARFRQGALDVLNGVVARAARATSPSLGGFVGAGALNYVLTRCRAVLSAELLPSADMALPDATVACSHPMDLIAGPAGTVLASADTSGISSWWDRVVAASAGRRPGVNPYPRGAKKLRVLPGFAAARDLVQHRLGRSVHAARGGGLPKRPGNALALVACGDVRTPQLVSRLVRSTAVAERCTSARLLNDLEVALAARRTDSVPVAIEASHILAAQLAWRWENQQRGFPERLTAPRHDLSILWGIPAIAHAVLRHAVAVDLRPTRVLG